MKSRLQALLHQESTAYTPNPYWLHPTGPVDIECRQTMAAWMTRVLRQGRLHRETGEIALSYTDRLVSYEMTRIDYQLYSMTALYTAIKCHETNALDVPTMAVLSNGAFDEEEILQAEQEMCQLLQWRLHPPTILSYIRLCTKDKLGPAKSLAVKVINAFPAARKSDLASAILHLLQIPNHRLPRSKSIAGWEQMMKAQHCDNSCPTESSTSSDGERPQITTASSPKQLRGNASPKGVQDPIS